jgi:GT2 family glycosyltransferase
MGVTGTARKPQRPAVSVCVAVYRPHRAPNVATLKDGLAGALDGIPGELVVALNGITPAQAGIGPDVRTVDLPVNRGVAPGWNAAAQAARGDVLVFANDDVALGPRSLAMLHAVLVEHPDAGVVGPVGTNWDLATANHQSWVDQSGLAPCDLTSCDVISGFLFAARREVYDGVGGFDEYYAPCSFEEVDFCTAVRTRLGLHCYALAGVAFEHEWGISRRSAPWRRISFDGHSESLRSIHRRNRSHFLAKWRDSTGAR